MRRTWWDQHAGERIHIECESGYEGGGIDIRERGPLSTKMMEERGAEVVEGECGHGEGGSLRRILVGGREEHV